MKFGIMIVASFLGWQAFAQSAPLSTEVEIDINGAPAKILASSFQQTLYIFDPDAAAGKPSCNAKCAEVWPPITLSAEEVAGLAGHADLGVQARDNGLQQLTYKGMPVYQFNLDRVAGDIKGDGIGGVWHIITL